MKFEFRGVKVCVAYPVVAFVCVMLVCDNQLKVIFCLIATVLHEVGHILAMKLTRCKINSISVKPGEIAINRSYRPLTEKQELLIASGGIAVNIIVSVVSGIIYFICDTDLFFNLSVANICVAVFNLLPIKSLDGGQILKMILENHFEDSVTEKISIILSVIFIIPVATIGFICLFSSGYNPSFILVAVSLICILIQRS